MQWSNWKIPPLERNEKSHSQQSVIPLMMFQPTFPTIKETGDTLKAKYFVQLALLRMKHLT